MPRWSRCGRGLGRRPLGIDLRRRSAVAGPPTLTVSGAWGLQFPPSSPPKSRGQKGIEPSVPAEPPSAGRAARRQPARAQREPWAAHRTEARSSRFPGLGPSPPSAPLMFLFLRSTLPNIPCPSVRFLPPFLKWDILPGQRTIFPEYLQSLHLGCRVALGKAWNLLGLCKKRGEGVL